MKKAILILTLALGALFSASSCSSSTTTTGAAPGGQSMPGMSPEEHRKMRGG